MENETVRKIKKYSNRKLYDMTEKKYISFDELSELIKSGEEVLIEDNETGEDITASVVAQLLARGNKDKSNDIPSSLLINLLRKGGGTVIGFAKKYTALWQNGLNIAEDEIDRLVDLLVKSKEISESEGGKLKNELLTYKENLKKWISNKIDQRVTEVLNMMNLATKEQMLELTAKIDALNKTVEKMEKYYAEIKKVDGA